MRVLAPASCWLSFVYSSDKQFIPTVLFAYYALLYEAGGSFRVINDIRGGDIIERLIA